MTRCKTHHVKELPWEREFYLNGFTKPDFFFDLKDIRYYNNVLKLSSFITREAMSEIIALYSKYNLPVVPRRFDFYLPESYGINWWQPKDDYRYLLKPKKPEPLSFHLLERAMKNLPFNVKLSFDNHWFNEVIKDTMEYHHMNMREYASYNQDQVYQNYDRDNFKLRREAIQAWPGNFRDILVSTVDHKKMIKYTDILLEGIAKSCINTAFKDPDDLSKIIKKNNQIKWKLSLDFKKYGNNIPHDLIRFFCKALEGLYNIDLGDYVYYLDHNELHVGDIPYTIQNGTGLGFGQYLHTLLNVVICSVLSNQNICLGDDSVIFCKKFSKTKLKVYLGFLTSLEMEYNLKKVILGENIHFLENVIDNKDPGNTKVNNFYLSILRINQTHDVIDQMSIFNSLNKNLLRILGMTWFDLKPHLYEIAQPFGLNDDMIIDSDFDLSIMYKEEILIKNPISLEQKILARRCNRKVLKAVKDVFNTIKKLKEASTFGYKEKENGPFILGIQYDKYCALKKVNITHIDVIRNQEIFLGRRKLDLDYFDPNIIDQKQFVDEKVYRKDYIFDIKSLTQLYMYNFKEEVYKKLIDQSIFYWKEDDPRFVIKEGYEYKLSEQKRMEILSQFNDAPQEENINANQEQDDLEFLDDLEF